MKAKTLLRSLCLLLFVLTIFFSFVACKKDESPEIPQTEPTELPDEDVTTPPPEEPPPVEPEEEPSVTYTFRDTDGTLLYRGEDRDYPLPADNEKWDYTAWEAGEKEDEYIADRAPQSDYFAGNVFHIIVKNLDQQPISTGSAFVFDDEGWFVTNAHVMQDAYYAQAIFNIPNAEKGESYTYLDIDKGTYHHADKDIYIGKIENYESIASHYKDIPIELTYELGETTYSVGYPNSSTSYKIQEGAITENWSDLSEKLYSGNTYICSSSNIAPGSSGGILTNGDLEVIGITTLGWFGKDGAFISGASISAFNFNPLLAENRDDEKLISVQERFHPEKKAYIAYFNEARDAEASGETERHVYDDGSVGYFYEWEAEDVLEDGTPFQTTELLSVGNDGFMEYSLACYWGNGDRKAISFYGYYNHEEGFVDFTYEFKYTFWNGQYYAIYSNAVNYSENLALTLTQYRLSSFFYQPTQDDVDYAKGDFNNIYELMTADIARFQ